MVSENVKEFNDLNFDAEVLKSATPVMVDFSTDWCPPCRLLAPTIEKLARDYVGKVKVGKVDTDANRDTPMKYKIDTIPTIVVFKDGQVMQMFRGLKSEKDLRVALDSVK
jgi:thioredoxin 1